MAKKLCGYRLPSGDVCEKGAKYGSAGAPRCKRHEGKRNKKKSQKVKTKKSSLKKKTKSTKSKRSTESKKTRKTRKTRATNKTSRKKGKKRPHTKSKISFFDVKTGKNIMVPREICKIKRNRSARGGDRITCTFKGRRYSTFVARGFEL